MKRIILLITALVLLFSSNAYAAEKRYPLTINIDGKDITVTTPFHDELSEKTPLPMYAVLRKLGYKVNFEVMGNDINPVKAEKGLFYFSTYTGTDKTWINDHQIKTKSQIITFHHVPYIEANYLKEALDLEVGIDKKDKKIKIKNKELKIIPEDEIKKKAESVVMLLGKSISDNALINQGSGFIISEDGKIVTNYHIIDGTKNLTVTFNNKEVYTGEVKVIGYDKVKDLAIIKINKNNLKPLLFGNPYFVAKGDTLYSISSPKKELNTFKKGRKHASWYYNQRETMLIQFDNITDHGSSGSPLFNNSGEVIGITSAGDKKYSLAIPINELKNIKLDKNLTLEELYKIEAK